MTDIVGFLAARLDEDEIAIKAMGVEGAGRWWVGQRFDGSLDPEGSTVFVDVRRSDGLGYIHLGAPGMFAGPTAIHIARHDPGRVLREVAAIRQILVEHENDWCICQLEDGVMKGAPCSLLKNLAAPYADHSDFKLEWVSS